VHSIKPDEFADLYTRVLTRVWSSEEFCRRFQDDPRVVLAEIGLEIPADSVLEIIPGEVASSDLALQLDLWRQGFDTGRFALHVPLVPQCEADELSEAELGDLAGGRDGHRGLLRSAAER
jgi:hypothetical protein